MDYFMKVDRRIARDRQFLKPTEKAVYYTISSYAHWTTKEAFPSVDTIARDTGVSRQTAHRAIRKLKEHGLIDVKNRYYEGGGQKSNKFTLLDVPEKFTLDKE